MVNQIKAFLIVVISLLASSALAQDSDLHTCTQLWNSNGGNDAKGVPLQLCTDLTAARSCRGCQNGLYTDRAGKTKIILDYTKKSATTMEITIQNGGTHIVSSKLVSLSQCSYCDVI